MSWWLVCVKYFQIYSNKYNFGETTKMARKKRDCSDDGSSALFTVHMPALEVFFPFFFLSNSNMELAIDTQSSQWIILHFYRIYILLAGCIIKCFRIYSYFVVWHILWQKNKMYATSNQESDRSIDPTCSIILCSYWY